MKIVNIVNFRHLKLNKKLKEWSVLRQIMERVIIAYMGIVSHLYFSNKKNLTIIIVQEFIQLRNHPTLESLPPFQKSLAHDHLHTHESIQPWWLISKKRKQSIKFALNRF